MAICVGIWSRDTETQVSDNLGSRLYLLEQALEATQAKAKELSTAHAFDRPIKSIFVAPEYLWSVERQDPHAARSISMHTRAALKSLLAEKSANYPGMLIVPGSIIFKVDLVESGALAPGRKDKALGRLQTATTKPKEYPVPSVPGTITTDEKVRLLTTGQATQLIKNRIYVFMDGRCVFSYGKKADMNEAVGADAGPPDATSGVFIPGLKAGLAEIGGIQFGFEICWEHQMGVLKTITTAQKKSPDIQIVCSAYVENVKSNMVVRTGGFVLHASSRADLSGVYYKAPVATGSTNKFAQPKIHGSAEPQAQARVHTIGQQTAGGSPLSIYVIDYE